MNAVCVPILKSDESHRSKYSHRIITNYYFLKMKVSSTETGHIFGTIVFDNSSTAQKTYVNLNDIQLDIMDYIRPAECKSEEFRSMWAEFEWENKVAINTNLTDLKDFLQHIISNTNMTCLSTPLGDSTAVRWVPWLLFYFLR